MSCSLPQDFLIYNSDWDYLVILDACRYDYFEEYYPRFLNGELIKAISKANRTKDWVEETFRKFMPAMYYTANPTINAIDHGDKFLGVKEIWRGRWNNELETVMPVSVNEIIRDEKPCKAIIHYLQPHFSTANFPLQTFSLYNKTVYKENMSIEQLKHEYCKNLTLGLDGVKQLISETNKKIIVTSDHGEMLGEDQLFFHEYSTHLYHPILREVPWFLVKPFP